MRYNWQQKDWTNFQYDPDQLENRLYRFAENTGRIRGIMEGLPKESHTQTLIDILVAEAIKTSEIEGEFLSRKDVASSIRNNLGFNSTSQIIKDKQAEGMATLITTVRDAYASPLTQEDLFKWHRLVFPLPSKLEIGAWRAHKEPMQIISGTTGREKVYFEAPPSKKIPSEMDCFIQWFNESAPSGSKEIKYAPIRSGISHLYFETIHPFEDGNGRIGRAIAEKTLLQTLGFPLLISLSASIEANRNDYYNALQEAQSKNEITPWLVYFTDVILQAQKETQDLVEFILKKTKLFDQYGSLLNERQHKAIKRMLQEGINGFEGGMTSKKYMAITKTSKPTATRDLQKLLEIGVFRVLGRGRNTSYEINFLDQF